MSEEFKIWVLGTKIDPKDTNKAIQFATSHSLIKEHSSFELNNLSVLKLKTKGTGELSEETSKRAEQVGYCIALRDTVLLFDLAGNCVNVGNDGGDVGDIVSLR